MNFLIHQLITDPAAVLDTPHFEHCYIYEGEHCSCGGNYQSDRPGPDIREHLSSPKETP